MLARIKNLLSLGALSMGMFIFNAAPVAAQNRTFKVVNESQYTIDRIYVSPTSYTSWGYDLLGRQVLRPGYEVTINLYPGFYDVKLVDEDNNSCVVNDVDFRNSDEITLTNRILVRCELATAF